MYAVIKTGGKQYKVKEGEVLKIERLQNDIGSTLDFMDVLMLSKADEVILGTPLVSNALVRAEVLKQGRHKKIKIIKFRRRKHHMKSMGHRQNYTEVKILSIEHSA